MPRVSLNSALVVAVAVAAALSASHWVLRPGAGQAQAASVEGTALVPMSRDGHYWATAEIDGRTLRLLVDTGASVVALTVEDARRLGVEPAAGDYDRTLRTANGATRAASVRLAAVTVGGARIENVDALVVEAGLPHSLLGMNYLSRLSGFSATPQALTLTL